MLSDNPISIIGNPSSVRCSTNYFSFDIIIITTTGFASSFFFFFFFFFWGGRACGKERGMVGRLGLVFIYQTPWGRTDYQTPWGRTEGSKEGSAWYLPDPLENGTLMSRKSRPSRGGRGSTGIGISTSACPSVSRIALFNLCRSCLSSWILKWQMHGFYFQAVCFRQCDTLCNPFFLALTFLKAVIKSLPPNSYSNKWWGLFSQVSPPHPHPPMLSLHKAAKCTPPHHTMSEEKDKGQHTNNNTSILQTKKSNNASRTLQPWSRYSQSIFIIFRSALEQVTDTYPMCNRMQMTRCSNPITIFLP